MAPYKPIYYSLLQSTYKIVNENKWVSTLRPLERLWMPYSGTKQISGYIQYSFIYSDWIINLFFSKTLIHLGIIQLLNNSAKFCCGGTTLAEQNRKLSDNMWAKNVSYWTFWLF